MYIKIEKKQNLNEWREQRRMGIGGSDISAIAGINPWVSPLEVYLDKIGELPEKEDNEAMYWGRVLEDVVAKEFALRTGKEVFEPDYMMQHKKYPFMIANVDRLIVGEEEGLECKTGSEYVKSHWKDDLVPEYYILQCQHYMFVTGLKGWWIAVLIGGNEFIYKYIPRDEDIINAIVTIESNFWEMVENRTPPAVDASESSGSMLNLLYPKDDGKEITLPEESLNLIELIDRQKEVIKNAELIKSEAENKLKEMMGENRIGTVGERGVVWSSFERTDLDRKALKKDNPELYKKYEKKSTVRKFSVR